MTPLDAKARLQAAIPQLEWQVDGDAVHGFGDGAHVAFTLYPAPGMLAIEVVFGDFDLAVQGLALGAAVARGEIDADLHRRTGDIEDIVALESP